MATNHGFQTMYYTASLDRRRNRKHHLRAVGSTTKHLQHQQKTAPRDSKMEIISTDENIKLCV